MLKRILSGALAIVAVAIALVVWVALTLRPPAPLVAPQGEFVLSGVTVVNPGRDRQENRRIVIRGPIIESISEAPPADAVDADAADPDATDIDATGATHAVRRFPGATVLPGLIDMHVHHPGAQAAADTQLFALLYLAHGVTAVRDTGNFDGSILGTRERILAGELAGPRIFACGPIFDGDPPVWPGSVVVRDAASAERAVDEVVATGVHCIKAYQNLSADALGGVRTAAKRHGLPLVGHVPFASSLEDAGLDDVQHLTGVAVGAHPPVGAAPSEMISWIVRSLAELDDEAIDRAAALSRERGIATRPPSSYSTGSRASPSTRFFERRPKRCSCRATTVTSCGHRRPRPRCSRPGPTAPSCASACATRSRACTRRASRFTSAPTP
jgi:Amidohydrolase family